MKHDNRSRALAKEERYEQILSVAAQVISEKGYKSASIQDIAKAMEFTSASLYHYVESKADLLADICNRAGTQLHESAQEILGLDLPPREKLRRLIKNHLDLLDSDREIFIVLLQERSELPEARMNVERERSYFDAIRSLLDEVGGRAGQNPRVGAYALLGMLNWVLRWYRRDGALTTEAVSDQFFDLFMNGYAAEPAGETTQ